jgi:NADPH2:quinone reductase
MNLHRASFRPAAGGVGQLAVQLAVHAGARVVGTASTEAKLAAVRGLGAEALLYSEDLAERVRALTGGRGADWVLDSVGRTTQAASLAMLARYGTAVFYGEASGPAAPVDVAELYDRSIRIGAFGLDTSDVATWSRARAELVQFVVSGALRVNVSEVFPLAAAAEAQRAIESRRTTGKILLDPTR